MDLYYLKGTTMLCDLPEVLFIVRKENQCTECTLENYEEE